MTVRTTVVLILLRPFFVVPGRFWTGTQWLLFNILTRVPGLKTNQTVTPTPLDSVLNHDGMTDRIKFLSCRPRALPDGDPVAFV